MIDCLPENSLSMYGRHLYSQSTYKGWILIRETPKIILNPDLSGPLGLGGLEADAVQIPPGECRVLCTSLRTPRQCFIFTHRLCRALFLRFRKRSRLFVFGCRSRFPSVASFFNLLKVSSFGRDKNKIPG
jgi:hypothetical protein